MIRWRMHYSCVFPMIRSFESEEVRPGLIVDLDSAGHIVGIELLDARSQLAAAALAELSAA